MMKKNTITLMSLVVFHFFSSVVSGQTADEKKTILKQTNTANLRLLQESFKSEREGQRVQALNFARANNLPLSFMTSEGNYAEIKEITANGVALYRETKNVGSAFTSRTNKLQPNGGLGLNLTGEGIFVGVWDQDNSTINHEDFGGRAFIYDNNTSPNSFHSSHVTGTIISSGANSPNGSGRGMAYKAFAYISNWNRDIEEMTELATNNGLLLSNHSYGLAASNANFPEFIFGAYRADSRDLDQIMFDAPYYQPVVAAGNDRNKVPNINSSKDGYDLLTDFSTAKNAIVVAAVEGLGEQGYQNPSSVVMSNFSSWGPTDDNRIKPDISTKGVNVFSTTNAASNRGYGTISGTSMATPGITGTLLLLQEHYRNLTKGFMRSATLRGLMAHAADEAGDAPGPDPKFGWGLMNAENAAILISKAFNVNSEAVIQEFDGRTTPLMQGATVTKVVKANGNQPLIATISWTDRAGTTNTGTVDLRTPVLVNDLDIRVTRNAEVFFPWKLSDLKTDPAIKGDNIVDNIEKVEVSAPANDFYTITVSHKGNLVGGSQDFSLLISGLAETTLSSTSFSNDNFKIWPNPAANVINVSGIAQGEEDVFVEIYSITGAKVLDKKIRKNDVNSVNSVNIEILSKGIYIIKVMQGNTDFAWKFSKE